jgi:hypothetical protein
MRSFLLAGACAASILLSCNHSEPSRKSEVSAADRPTDAVVELGHVRWQRKLEPALDEAARKDRPVLLFFQEVPG